jgi:23S rRNA G2445 N2-methylase RlmL
MAVQRCDELRLSGSGGANRVMEAEFKRLVMRSPFEVRVEKPKREGESTLLYPFDACLAWVAACYHRTSSRISWDLCSSDAVRLEPLFDDLLPALLSDDRLPSTGSVRYSVEVGAASDFEASPLQLRGVVKNALAETFTSHGVATEIDPDEPDIVFVVRRSGAPESRRTVVAIDIGGGARHRRGARVAMGPAPLRETLASQLIMLSRWDARSEPLIDPMTGGGTIPIEAAGLAVGAAIRRPGDLLTRHLPAFHGLPREAPDLFPGTTPRILALDNDSARIPAIVGNLRAAGLTGSSHEDSIVMAQQDMRHLTPDIVHRLLPAAKAMQPGVFCFNPPYGVRMGAEAGDKKLLALYSDIGRALTRFRGWRAACFVANPHFVGAFGHRPAMTKPASNAELRGAFLVYEL